MMLWFVVISCWILAQLMRLRKKNTQLTWPIIKEPRQRSCTTLISYFNPIIIMTMNITCTLRGDHAYKNPFSRERKTKPREKPTNNSNTAATNNVRRTLLHGHSCYPTKNSKEPSLNKTKCVIKISPPLSFSSSL